MRNTAGVTGGKNIAVVFQSISGVSAINPLVAFYDIHGKKREVLFFYFVSDTTRDSLLLDLYYLFLKNMILIQSSLIPYWMKEALISERKHQYSSSYIS
jgi:hypothetical protein